MSVENVACDIYRIGGILEREEHDGRCGVTIDFHPEWEKSKTGQYVRPEAGTTDHWSARWRGHVGTGATCEMALLELERSMREKFDDMIAREQQRIDEASARIATIKAMQGTPNQSGEE